MLYFFYGTDREKAQSAMDAAIRAEVKRQVVRITDANQPADLRAALQGAGMFGGERFVVLDGTFENEEMAVLALDALPSMKASEERFFILEGKLDADTRHRVEKFAEKSQRFDAPAKKKDGDIFALGRGLGRGGDKKSLWITYQRELGKGSAPEAIHGVLFWGVKDAFLRAKARSPEHSRGAELIARLAELPHEARRRGEELEYALERFILRGV